MRGELDYILPQSQTATRYYSPMQEVKSLNNGLAISSNNSLNPMTSQMISNQSSIKMKVMCKLVKSKVKLKPQMVRRWLKNQEILYRARG